MMEFNWEGLAELGWRSTQRINDHNVYWNWDELTDVEKQIIQRRWQATPVALKYQYTKMAEAVVHAYVAAATA